jgi:hypothetical protein
MPQAEIHQIDRDHGVLNQIALVSGPTRDGVNLLDTTQAAARLGLKPCTLEKWRSTGGGPRYVKLGRCVRYRIVDLDGFTESRLRAHTA